MKPDSIYAEIFRDPTGWFYLRLFSTDGYQYMWRSPRYRWLWQTRLWGRRAAVQHIQRTEGNLDLVESLQDVYVATMRW